MTGQGFRSLSTDLQQPAVKRSPFGGELLDGPSGVALVVGVVAFALGACRGEPELVGPDVNVIRIENVRASLTALAHDSMEGRRTGSRGAERAAHFIAQEMEGLGLEPGGDDDGYLQWVPIVSVHSNGRRLLMPLLEAGGMDSAPPDILMMGMNVVGVLPGADPELRHESVVVGAHYDHLGVGTPVEGDSIYNGADDNASGVVAVLEAARSMQVGPRPKRTVVFVAFTGEEMGLLGSYYHVHNPVLPLEAMVAHLQIEMIGRSDRAAGGRGRVWLTGDERSTLGELLREHGLPVVPDPRPEENFFGRSDNIVFAQRGVPAHTMSSFNLHPDYHRPSDVSERIDFEHMTRVVRVVARSVRHLADGPAPQWRLGGQPDLWEPEQP